MAVRFLVLLSVFLLNFSKGQTLISKALSGPPPPSTNPQDQILSATSKPRTLETNTTSSCDIVHCKSCDFSSKTCKHCTSGYKLTEGFCVSARRSSSSSLGLVPLIVLILGLIIFSVIFCILCIFFARKQKPRYAGHQNLDGDLTKSVSIVTDYLTDEAQPPSTLLHSPDNENSFRSADTNFRTRRLRLRQAYKSLTSLPKSMKLDGECSICFEMLSGFELKRLKCNHLLHRNCCREWMKTGNASCPTCGVEITCF